MKITKYALVALGLIALLSGTVRADEFSALGIFTDGSVLTGTVAIDTTLGAVTALDLTTSAPDSLTWKFIQAQGLATYGGQQVEQFDAGTTASGLPNLDLGIFTSGSVNPLIGYTGGLLTSDLFGGTATASDIFYSPTNAVDLVIGVLTPISTPEPSSLLLLGTGLLGLMAMNWRCKRARVGLPFTS